MSDNNQQNSSQFSAQLIADSSPGHSESPNKGKEVVISYDQGQLQQSDELGEVQLLPATSVEVRRSVEVSTELPEINIKANKSAYIPRGNEQQGSERIKYKKPYSEPRSERDDDNFSDREASETQNQARNRNILVSIAVGGVAAIAGYYLSKEDKRVAGLTGLVMLLGTYFSLSS